MQLNTERLILRPILPNDIENIFRGLSHPEVIRYYGVSFRTLEETKEQMAWYRSLEQEGTGRWWAICPPSGEFCGAIGYNNYSAVHRKAEIGFWLLPDFWGRGLATEALQEVIRFGFDTWRLHRIEAFVETENVASVQALKRFGFTHEGTLRECEVKNGRYISLDIMALIET